LLISIVSLLLLCIYKKIISLFDLYLFIFPKLGYNIFNIAYNTIKNKFLNEFKLNKFLERKKIKE